MRECDKLHYIFNNMKRLKFPFKKEDVPGNGIYILFEKGEHGHDGDRIVRIGTHTGEGQLRSRLKQHFIKENKDRSIFRKNIGRSILSKCKDPFLKYWEYDLTPRKSRDKYLPLLDMAKQQEVEKAVTSYIQSSFSFIVFEVEGKEQRLQLESKIISTVSLCDCCKPSKNWLGTHSPKNKIRESGLWLVNELYKEPLSLEEIACVHSLIRGQQKEMEETGEIKVSEGN